MSYQKTVLGFAALGLFLSGCESTSRISPQHGVSIDSAFKNQVVSSAAVPGAPVMNPQMVDAAIQRYLDDEVKQPEAQSTSGSGGGGGGGGGSN